MSQLFRNADESNPVWESPESYRRTEERGGWTLPKFLGFSTFRNTTYYKFKFKHVQLWSMFCHVRDAHLIPTDAWLMDVHGRKERMNVRPQHNKERTHTHTHCHMLRDQKNWSFEPTQGCTYSSKCLSWPSTSSVVYYTQVASPCSLAE